MTFTSLLFLFLFLPAVLLVNYLLRSVPVWIRQLFLLAVSLLFYAWGDIKYLPVFAMSILLNFCAGQAAVMLRTSGREMAARIALAAAAGLDIAALALFKYSSLDMPLGVSFYTFSLLSYLFDIWQGRTENKGIILTVSLYMVFFPKVISGPVIQYKDFIGQTARPRLTRDNMVSGMHLFLIGLFKKVLLADNLGTSFQSVLDLGKMAGASAWLGMVFYSLQLYFDFSGYSDMAIGLARMLGFQIDRNFHYPYMSKNIADFWRRWHISLGAWFRNYVYIPLGGNRCALPRQIINLAVVWLLTGIWHGNTLNFIAWGIWHGLLVILQKFVIKDRAEAVPGPVRILITDLLAFIGWVFFFSPNLGSALHYFGQMLGRDGLGAANGATWYILRQNILLLAAAVIGSTPLPANLKKLIYKRGGRAMSLCWAIAGALIFILCIANLVGSGYQTFLYFKF